MYFYIEAMASAIRNLFIAGVAFFLGFLASFHWYEVPELRTVKTEHLNQNNLLGEPMPRIQHFSDTVKTIRNNIELSVGILVTAPADKKIVLVYQDEDKLFIEMLVSLFTVSGIEPFWKEGVDGGYQLVIPLEAAKIEQYHAALPNLPSLP